jgi:general bacterial porin, GBP family
MKFTNKMLAATLLALGLSSAATAADSSVTLYGILDAGMQVSTQSLRDYSSSNVGLVNGVQNGNRFGIKGSEDLGSGLRATFVLEAGFNLGSGASQQNGTLFGRQSWVGVESDTLGYARLGKQYNFATDYVGAIDPFLLGFGQANMGATFGSANTTRYNNMVKYQSPTWNGVTAGIGYSFATGLTSVYADQAALVAANSYNYATMNNARAITAGVKYASGPLTVVGSYDVMYGPANIVGSGASNPSQWIVGGAYDFTVAKVAAAYSQSRNGWINGQASVDPTFSANAYGGGAGGVLYDSSFGANSYLVGATVPVTGTQKVFTSYQYSTPVASMAYASNLSIYSVGYQYDFSKRTNAYAYASQAQNYAFLDGAKSTVYGVGLRHQF